MLGGILLAVLVVVIIGTTWALTRWRPRPRWADRDGRDCPGCGGFRVTTVNNGTRLDGMLECRACARVWSPEDHTRG
ncbi:hypothetical protein ABZ714_16675 [Streptomyces sp. NPDC006798]|uniref:hypothetical protein n=1 Tax=Streptomyces sp. NPDC006798 TaxID=3155462 RepID=UPI0033FC32A0